MAVGTDDTVTGSHHALFRQQRMLNAHFAHIVEVADAVGTGKLPAGLALLGSLNILVWNKVIQNDYHFLRIIYPIKTGLLKLVHSHRGGNIIAQYNVQVRLNQLSRSNLRKSRVSRQDFLCHCHCHSYLLLTR